MSAIVAFEQVAAERLQALAASEPMETCAAGLVAPAGLRDGCARYVVRDLQPVPDSAYLSRGHAHASLSPGFCIDLSNRARVQGMGILVAHTHPGEAALQSFSTVDDQGEQPMRDYFGRRVPTGPHFAAMFTRIGGQCRKLGTQELARIQLVGKDVRWLSHEQLPAHEPQARFARQVLAFGTAVQTTLASLRVAIVGLGGTGAFIATELAHLGVDNFFLIDPDFVEETNLNRLVGATPEDRGTPKVDLFARRIQAINPDAECDVAVADVVDDAFAKRLLDTDFIFLCTDSHASRAVVNQIAYQYLIPSIDMGVAIHTRDGKVTHVVGRTQMLSSGMACLVCAGWINSSQVRIEMMTAEQRRNDAYFPGETVDQPAVISLNGAVASMAITTFLSAMAALPSEARMIHYDAIRGSMRPTVMSPTPGCIVCSPDGALARGATWSLPTRHT